MAQNHSRSPGTNPTPPSQSTTSKTAPSTSASPTPPPPNKSPSTRASPSLQPGTPGATTSSSSVRIRTRPTSPRTRTSKPNSQTSTPPPKQATPIPRPLPNPLRQICHQHQGFPAVDRNRSSPLGHRVLNLVPPVHRVPDSGTDSRYPAQ